MIIECLECNKTFQKENAYIMHERYMHNIDITQCCTKCNKIKDTVTSFYKQAHGTYYKVCKTCYSLTNNKSNKVKCEYCNKIMERRVLKRHQISKNCA